MSASPGTNPTGSRPSNRFAEQEGVAAALREMVEGRRAAHTYIYVYIYICIYIYIYTYTYFRKQVRGAGGRGGRIARDGGGATRRLVVLSYMAVTDLYDTRKQVRGAGRRRGGIARNGGGACGADLSLFFFVFTLKPRVE